jgi:hypothetical protein
MENKGIGGHQKGHRGRAESWLTPLPLIRSIGEFDLDPCGSWVEGDLWRERHLWPTAKKIIVPPEDGLTADWVGHVWLNPPYGPETHKWLQRMAEHNNGVALIFARTETKQFFDWVWPHARAMLFLQGRITFYTPDGVPSKYNAGAPSVLVAYGEWAEMRLFHADIRGAFVYWRKYV